MWTGEAEKYMIFMHDMKKDRCSVGDSLIQTMVGVFHFEILQSYCKIIFLSPVLK